MQRMMVSQDYSITKLLKNVLVMKYKELSVFNKKWR